MRKFVIVMIALLVLFVFLMLNYLLWDKETLQNQSATDKIDLEQLRSTNRTLQATVDEQEQSINSLEKDNENYKTKVAEQEQAINRSAMAQNSLNEQLKTKSQAIDDYKLLMADSLKLVMQQWFDNVTNQNYEAAFQALDTYYTLFGSHYGQDEFSPAVAPLKSIAFVRQNKDEAAGNTPGNTEGSAGKGDSAGKTDSTAKEGSFGDSSGESADASTGDSAAVSADLPALPVFEVLPGRGSEYQIIALADVEVQIADDKKDTYKELAEGTNRLQISFQYNPANKTWAILSIMEVSE